MRLPTNFRLSPYLLPSRLRGQLRALLVGRPLALCFGAGVDSTAMMVLLRACGLRPTLITFADTGGEKPETLHHLARIGKLMRAWGWPDVVRCVKQTLASTGYHDLYGNCIANETLPSLAFGMKSCSLKWKAGPQDQYIMGASKGPGKRPPHEAWLAYQATGERIVKLIGYDCGIPDRRRSARLATADAHFEYIYPLQVAGWSRQDCIEAIAATLGADWVPIKSACFFCPASRPWELFWLAAHHPELLDAALYLERRALTGRHSRFDKVEFGASWEQIVASADRFPSSATTVGLGRSFAWNQWARVNDVVDQAFCTRRDAKAVARFMLQAEAQRDGGNALDVRTSTNGRYQSLAKISVIAIDGQ